MRTLKQRLRGMDSYRASDEVAPADLYEAPHSRFSARESFRTPHALGGAGVGFPWRTTAVATFLFALGVSFIVIGAEVFWHKHREAALGFVIVGSVAFVPGVYACYALVQSWRGVEGFELHQGTFCANADGMHLRWKGCRRLTNVSCEFCRTFTVRLSARVITFARIRPHFCFALFVAALTTRLSATSTQPQSHIGMTTDGSDGNNVNEGTRYVARVKIR